MSNLPPEIKSKIEAEAIKQLEYTGFKRGATFGYSLAEGEINRLLSLLRREVTGHTSNASHVIDLWQQFKTENNL